MIISEGLSIDELHRLYDATLWHARVDLLNEPDEIVAHEIFRELDAGVEAFLADESLARLQAAGLISAQVAARSAELRRGLSSLRARGLWTLAGFRSDSEWRRLLELSDAIKYAKHLEQGPRAGDRAPRMSAQEMKTQIGALIENHLGGGRPIDMGLGALLNGVAQIYRAFGEELVKAGDWTEMLRLLREGQSYARGGVQLLRTAKVEVPALLSSLVERQLAFAVELERAIVRDLERVSVPVLEDHTVSRAARRMRGA